MSETLVRTIDDVPELDLDAFRNDPMTTLDRLRPHRLVRSERGFEVIGYELAYELLGDQRLRPMSAADFASHGASPYVARYVDEGIFLFMEPERHRQIRKVFARGFAAKTVTAHRDATTATAVSLIDRLLAAGSGDLVGDFTQRFTAEVLCRLIGFPPQDIPLFVDAALDMRHMVYVPMAPHLDKLEKALSTLRAYTEPLLEERRRNPREDFLTSLIDAEATLGRLSTDELVWGTVNLLQAGIDTTNFQLASTLKHLIDNASWDKVSNDADAREGAIEEAMRLTPISTMLGRVVHEPLVIDGVALPAGADVKINMVGAGRDPEKFEHPHTYRLDRERPYFPAVFGNGVHTCIGKNLAWLELRVGLELITSRLTDVTFCAPVRNHSWTDAFYGPLTLPSTFTER